jgi:hypothetical protein
MSDTKVICEGCKQWIGRLPNIVGNMIKSFDTALDSGWLRVWCGSRNNKRTRTLWYCAVCSKKTTVAEMVDSV